MSWLIFLGNLAKILFLDSHAKNLQVRTYLGVFLVSTMARSWQDLPRFSMFLSRCTKFRFTGNPNQVLLDMLGLSHYSPPHENIDPTLRYICHDWGGGGYGLSDH